MWEFGSPKTSNVCPYFSYIQVSIPGIILGAKFSPWAIFPCFFPKNICQFAFFKALFCPISTGKKLFTLKIAKLLYKLYKIIGNNIDWLRFKKWRQTLLHVKWSRIILGANFSPVGYFSMFFSEKDSPFCIFWSPISPNFDGIKFFQPKCHQIII